MGEPAGTMSALVVAGDEEIRVLLRGLLRLYHFRVLGEADSEPMGIDLLRQHHPRLVVIDTNIGEGSPTALIEGIRRIEPDARTVLVAPHSYRAGTGVAPDAILQRPFRVREFAEAVGAAPAAAP